MQRHLSLLDALQKSDVFKGMTEMQYEEVLSLGHRKTIGPPSAFVANAYRLETDVCAGCPADLFLNLADVAKEYGLDQRAFLDDPQKAIGSAGGHHHHGNGSKA
jgi:hypothetical protein